MCIWIHPRKTFDAGRILFNFFKNFIQVLLEQILMPLKKMLLMYIILNIVVYVVVFTMSDDIDTHLLDNFMGFISVWQWFATL